MTVPLPAPTRVRKRMVKLTNGCWRTDLRLSPSGFPRVTVHGRDVLARIVMWQEAYGPLPDGSELRAICGDRLCVNPEHMQPMTHSELMTASLPKCPPDHVRVTRRKGDRLSSYCKTCRNRRDRLNRAGLGTLAPEFAKFFAEPQGPHEHVFDRTYEHAREGQLTVCVCGARENQSEAVDEPQGTASAPLDQLAVW